MRLNFQNLSSLYRKTLLDDVISFWEKYSVDAEYGGYFTCLDRKGQVFDTDKFIWLQCRQVWMFSFLYQQVAQEKRWYDIARCGKEFLERYGRDEQGSWFFSLNRQGQPLTQPYSIFSDCFAAMAFSQYAKSFGDQVSRDIALTTYNNIMRRRENHKGKYSKVYPGTRPSRSLALPMILSNLSTEMSWLLTKDQVTDVSSRCVQDIMNLFRDKQTGLLYEHVAPDGSHPDCFEGRLINPGHSLEAMWFVMDIACEQNDSVLIKQAVESILCTIEFGWDKKYGGIFYFMDVEGKPPQQLEWDQKLWWVHLESLVALIMGYLLADNKECLQWFEKVHEYTWSHFPDCDHGEWFGYLNRKGDKLLQLKGGKWKGCFHLPRALFLCSRHLERLSGQVGCQ